MGNITERMQKQFDELLGLVSKEDRPKAVKLLWEMLRTDSRGLPIELLVMLSLLENELKRLGIRPYLT